MLRASPSVACTGRCRPVHVHVQLLNDRMSKATTSADSRCRATGRPADSEAAPTSDRLPHDVASTSSAARLPPNPSLVTSGYGYTLSSMYVPKAEKPVFKDLDHLTRRRERDIKEICEVCRACACMGSCTQLFCASCSPWHAHHAACITPCTLNALTLIAFLILVRRLYGSACQILPCAKTSNLLNSCCQICSQIWTACVHPSGESGATSFQRAGWPSQENGSKH